MSGDKHFCRCCRQTIVSGISLDDSDDQHVCDSCWSKVPHGWRLIISQFYVESAEQLKIESEQRQREKDIQRSIFGDFGYDDGD